MKLEITSVPDAGNLEKERVVMKTTADADVGRFALFQGRLMANSKIQSGDIPHVYWFVDKQIKSGDPVILYTKSGASSEKKNTNGTTSHFFYWGLFNPLWDLWRDTNRC